MNQLDAFTDELSKLAKQEKRALSPKTMIDAIRRAVDARHGVNSVVPVDRMAQKLVGTVDSTAQATRTQRGGIRAMLKTLRGAAIAKAKGIQETFRPLGKPRTNQPTMDKWLRPGTSEA